MTNSILSTQVLAGTALVALALMVFGTPLQSHAASYAYVDNTGEVKSVVANDWMTAILTAPNIFIHSGVMLLNSAADYDMVGDNVPSV